MRCCIKSCGSYYADRALNISFFGFPAEPDIRKKWLEIINQKDMNPTRKTKVCSLHFKPEEIIRISKGCRLVHGTVPRLSNDIDYIKEEIEDFEELDTSFEVQTEISMPEIEIKEESPIEENSVVSPPSSSTALQPKWGSDRQNTSLPVLPLSRTQNLAPHEIISYNKELSGKTNYFPQGAAQGSGKRTILVQHLTLVRSQASQTDIVGSFMSQSITQASRETSLAPPVQKKITSDDLKSTPRVTLKEVMASTPDQSAETTTEIKKLLCQIELLKKNITKKDKHIKTLLQKARRNKSKIDSLTALFNEPQNKV